MKMSKEEILKMPAGREIDALVAEEIFGYRWVEGILAFGQPCLISPEHYENTKVPIANTNKRKIGGTFPRYSIKISDAWKIVEKLDTFQFNFDNGYSTDPNERCLAEFGHGMLGMTDYIQVEATAPTAYLAICRVALLTKIQ